MARDTTSTKFLGLADIHRTKGGRFECPVAHIEVVPCWKISPVSRPNSSERQTCSDLVLLARRVLVGFSAANISGRTIGLDSARVRTHARFCVISTLLSVSS